MLFIFLTAIIKAETASPAHKNKRGRKMKNGFFELFKRYPVFLTKAVTLSFDDGYNDDKKMVALLNEYGIKCTFNINSGNIEGNSAKVQFEELEDLYKGHEIAAHSYTHPHLHYLDFGGIAYQIIKDRETLEEKTGRIIRGFAYPYGLHETAGMVDCIAKCGIKYGRTTAVTHNFDLPGDYLRWNPTCHHADPKLPELAKSFFMPDDSEHPWRIKPQLFYIWGHYYEFKDKWENLENICKTVGRKENVWYCTNMEIVEYISAFEQLKYSVNGKIVYNPTSTDLYVVANGKNIILKKGETMYL